MEDTAEDLPLKTEVEDPGDAPGEVPELASLDPDLVTVLDDQAQHFIDTEVLDQTIQNLRREYAQLRVTFLMSQRGLLPKQPGGKGVHAEEVKKDVLKVKEALDLFVGIGRNLRDSRDSGDGLATIPAPSPLEVASLFDASAE